MAIESHRIMGGKVYLYRRGGSDHWHCSTFLKSKNHRKSTKQDSLSLAKEIAEDWYLTLHGKSRAGVLETGPTFKRAADQFVKEYGVITEGERSQKWTESHGMRLRVHLVPFFGPLPLNKVTPGKVQEYRVHRMTSYNEPNPASKSRHQPKKKPASPQHVARRGRDPASGAQDRHSPRLAGALRWSPETGQAAKRESLLGAADRPQVRHDQYSEETRS
jgi:hypothetical protein